MGEGDGLEETHKQTGEGGNIEDYTVEGDKPFEAEIHTTDVGDGTTETDITWDDEEDE